MKIFAQYLRTIYTAPDEKAIIKRLEEVDNLLFISVVNPNDASTDY